MESWTLGLMVSLMAALINICMISVGPFLQRLHTDRFMRVLFDLTIQLYEVILRVDNSVHHLKYMDAGK